jgi:glucose-6-phosphate isomerase
VSIDDVRRMANRVPPLTELFGRDAHRSSGFTHDACGIHADFSRQSIDGDLLDAALDMCATVDVGSKIAAMFAGEHLNVTEDRAVMHVALRSGDDASPEARAASAQLTRAFSLADEIRSSGRFDCVVNIGIGGSHLGPAMVTNALRRHHDGPRSRFVSNIDPADLDGALEGLDPTRTLFVVSSKTFTTLETLHNAERARAWLSPHVRDWSAHFVAATANPSVAEAWGIAPERCLEFYDWVGGRFSVSSVIGFPVMCAIGPEKFAQFLGGMREMDEHFRDSRLSANLPVLHAITWWLNLVGHGRPTVAVVPYGNDLADVPAFLQQLVMESNGKSVDAKGLPVVHPASPVVWGEPGTNGQHAFFQFLHQGTHVVPVEFISSVTPMGQDTAGHDLLIANMLAQSEALAAGSESDEPHRRFAGNRPSSVIMMRSLDPRTLGSLISLYEHSTVVQGWLSGVNSFDQFGVELGKRLASDSAKSMHTGTADASLTMTHPLMEWYLRNR